MSELRKQFEEETGLDSDVEAYTDSICVIGYIEWLESQNKKLIEFIKNDVSTYNENYTHPDELVEKAEQIIKELSDES